jgi:hypothetical protein
MSARATFRQADLGRALKEAKKHGYEVVLENGSMRFLPIDPNAPLPSSDQSESDWRGKLAAWRRSA